MHCTAKSCLAQQREAVTKSKAGAKPATAANPGLAKICMARHGGAMSGQAKGASEERPKAERYRPLVRNKAERSLAGFGTVQKRSAWISGARHREAVRRDRRWSDTAHWR